jgi:hypothetical protein
MDVAKDMDDQRLLYAGVKKVNRRDLFCIDGESFGSLFVYSKVVRMLSVSCPKSDDRKVLI